MTQPMRFAGISDRAHQGAVSVRKSAATERQMPTTAKASTELNRAFGVTDAWYPGRWPRTSAPARRLLDDDLRQRLDVPRRDSRPMPSHVEERRERPARRLIGTTSMVPSIRGSVVRSTRGAADIQPLPPIFDAGVGVRLPHRGRTRSLYLGASRRGPRRDLRRTRRAAARRATSTAAGETATPPAAIRGAPARGGQSGYVGRHDQQRW